MKGILNQLIRIGIRRNDDFQMRTLKIALNVLLYNTLLIQLVAILYGVAVEGNWNMLYLLISFPFYALVLLLNYLDKAYLAVTILFSTGSVFLTIFSIYSGEGSMTHIFFALTVMGLSILYRRGLYRTFYFINLGFTLLCFVFVICSFQFDLFTEFRDPMNDVALDQRMNAYIIMFGAVLFSLVVVISNGRQYDRLYQADKQKELLLAELNHRVKNNLAIILSLIRLKRDGLDEVGVRAFLDLEGRITSMAVVHDDVYSRDGKTSVKVKAYINKLLDGICATYNFKKVGCEVGTDQSELPIDQALPFAMILNELVVNSMKHAFKDTSEPHIEIEFRSTGDQCIFNYKDNGVGFDLDQERSENSLGLELIHSLADQLDAKKEMKSKGGFHFQMIFSKKS